LMWYLERGVVPNLKCIENIKNKEDLKKKLLEAVNKVDSRSIKFDLESLIADREFVNNLSKNLKSILRRNL